jgi:BTB/POZ domain-containing protein 3/6
VGLTLTYNGSGGNGGIGMGGSGSSTPKDEWELTKTGVRERNAAMCNNELMADIHFIVSSNGGESVKYPAHKYVLAVGSSVFFAMFYGSLAETSAEIVVPDVEPEAFLKMLQFLYSDEINLDEDSVLATLHVGKKYIIPQLARACVQFLESNLTARNACVLLSQSRIFDEPELMERCWEVIDAQAELALNSEGFLEIDHSTLESIMSRETLKCRELSIFNAAMAWATAECDRREIEATAGNLRACLGKALQLIRVPTMELKEFADGPAQTGIFSLEESHAMFLHFTATTKPKVGYPTTPRAGLTPQVCHRFQSSAYRSNQWRYRGRCDSIQFCVDRRVFIVGFGLYGSSGGAATYAVHIELKRLGRVLAENDTEFFSDGSSNTFHVYFDQPVQIDPDTYYTASAVLDGLELSYFGQEGMTDVQVGNVTFQFQCSAESTNGTGVQGGQIPELIFYGPSEPTLNK